MCYIPNCSYFKLNWSSKYKTRHLRLSQNTSSNLPTVSEDRRKAKNNRWIGTRGFLADVEILGWLEWRIMNNLWWWWEGGTWQPYGGPGAGGVVIRWTVNEVKTWKWLWYDEGSEKHTQRDKEEVEGDAQLRLSRQCKWVVKGSGLLRGGLPLYQTLIKQAHLPKAYANSCSSVGGSNWGRLHCCPEQCWAYGPQPLEREGRQGVVWTSPSWGSLHGQVCVLETPPGPHSNYWTRCYRSLYGNVSIFGLHWRCAVESCNVCYIVTCNEYICSCDSFEFSFY